jgi:hypothetical protein
MNTFLEMNTFLCEDCNDMQVLPIIAILKLSVQNNTGIKVTENKH